MVPIPSASTLSLSGRDSNDRVSDGLRGHLGKVAWCTKNILLLIFLVFYPCFRMLYIPMVQNSKYKKAHRVESLFPTQ